MRHPAWQFILFMLSVMIAGLGGYVSGPDMSAACVLFGFFGILAVLLWALWDRWGRKKASKVGPDSRIHKAIDYIVNDSDAELRGVPANYDYAIVSKFGWQGEEHHHALETVREKAMAGKLRAWGHIQIGHPSAMTFDIVLHEIPAEYWHSATFNVAFCFHQTDHPQTYVIGNREGLRYRHITLSQSQVIIEWPRKALWRRIAKVIRRDKRLSYRSGDYGVGRVS